jgi:cation diffusion facilitator family transporter
VGILVINLATAAAKLGVGEMAGSLALSADGVHALLDGSSNVVGLVGIWLAAKPADEGHPYGHRRFETLAAIVIGLAIVAGLFTILDALVEGVVTGSSQPVKSPLATGVTAASIVVTLMVSRYERRRGEELHSEILIADAGHTLSDALASMVVLASFVGGAVGLRWADLAAAAIVCVFIGRTAWQILARNLQSLADAAQLDPEVLRRVALDVDGVRAAHHVRSRGSKSHVHVDLHIEVDAQMPLARAHRLTHGVEEALRVAFPEICDVVIHTEPAPTDRSEIEDTSP